MGGDNAPDIVLQGVELFLDYCSRFDRDSVSVVLVGDRAVFTQFVPKYISDKNLSSIAFQESEGVVKNSPSAIFKGQGFSSSMVVGMRTLVSSDSGWDAFVSAGDSGAFMVAAMKYVGLLDGLLRTPAIISIPRLDGSFFYLIDAGVNVDCKPIHLLHFTQLGHAFAQKFLDKESPKVVLASNGEEDSKGNKLILEVGAFLRSFNGINFCGNLDCMKMFSHDFDVVVCDGFVGNIILKIIESSFGFCALKNSSQDQYKSFSPSSSWIRSIQSEDISAAALLLGVKKNCILVHGSADALAIQSSLIFSLRIIEKECIASVENISFI